MAKKIAGNRFFIVLSKPEEPQITFALDTGNITDTLKFNLKDLKKLITRLQIVVSSIIITLKINKEKSKVLLVAPSQISIEIKLPLYFIDSNYYQ